MEEIKKQDFSEKEKSSGVQRAPSADFQSSPAVQKPSSVSKESVNKTSRPLPQKDRNIGGFDSSKTKFILIIFLLFLFVVVILLAVWLIFLKGKGGLPGPANPPTPSAVNNSISNQNIVSPSAAAARDNRRKSDLNQLQLALEMYYNTKGSYPVSEQTSMSTQEGFLNELVSEGIIASVPQDPKAGEGWYYGYRSDGKSYELSARLENTSDPACQMTSSGYCLYFITNK